MLLDNAVMRPFLARQLTLIPCFLLLFVASAQGARTAFSRPAPVDWACTAHSAFYRPTMIFYDHPN